MSKTLVVGTDYGFCFGLPAGAQMIYNGGISWTGKMGGQEMTLDSQKQVDGALAYINKPSVHMGDPKRSR